jgi:hypothetical protein
VQALLSNYERRRVGELLIDWIEPIADYDRVKWSLFWIGFLVGILCFWALVMDGTFRFADVRNWTLFLPYMFLSGGIGGCIARIFFWAFAGWHIKKGRRALLMIARGTSGARLLAHIRDTHSEDTWRNRRIRKVIEQVFNKVNET